MVWAVNDAGVGIAAADFKKAHADSRIRGADFETAAVQMRHLSKLLWPSTTGRLPRL